MRGDDQQGSAQWSLDALTQAAHAAGIQVSRATFKRYVKQRREIGTVLPRPIPGRPPKKVAALQAGVQELLEAYPNARLEDYCQ